MRRAALLLLLGGALGQMSMSAEEEEMMEAMGIKGQPMGRKNLNPQAEIFKQDLKYIYCGVCRKMVEKALEKSTELLEKRFQQLKKKRRKHETTEFDGEGAVQEYVEKMCNPLKPEGDWVGTIDLKHEGEALVLAQQPGFGKCQKECRTIEYACNECSTAPTPTSPRSCTLRCQSALERTCRAAAVAWPLTCPRRDRYNAVKDQEELEKVQRYICNRAAGVCKKKPPPLTKTRKHDEKFQAMSVRTARFWRANSARNSARNSAQFGATRRNSSAILTAQFLTTPQADEKQMQDMQANLKETGMSGTMYRREDLRGMMDKMKDMVSAHAARPPRNSARNSLRNSLSSALSSAVPRGRPGDGYGRRGGGG